MVDSSSASPSTKKIKVSNDNIAENLPKAEEQESENNCSICLQSMEDRTVIPTCSHEFCFECLLVWAAQSRRCPLCTQTIGDYVIHDIRSRYDYRKHHLAPLHSNSPPMLSLQSAAALEARNAARRRRRRREQQRRQRENMEEQDRLELSIEKRRWVYKHNVYAKHVASNPFTKYRPYPTPAQFSASSELVSRTTTFIRRELQVWQSLDIEFLTNLIISLMKSIDIRSETAVKLLAEFLDMGGEHENQRVNAEHFAHEVYCYVRSPYRDLFVYDGVVQYDHPTSVSPPPEGRRRRNRWRESTSEQPPEHSHSHSLSPSERRGRSRSLGEGRADGEHPILREPTSRMERRVSRIESEKHDDRVRDVDLHTASGLRQYLSDRCDNSEQPRGHKSSSTVKKTLHQHASPTITSFPFPGTLAIKNEDTGGKKIIGMSNSDHTDSRQSPSVPSLPIPASNSNKYLNIPDNPTPDPVQVDSNFKPPRYFSLQQSIQAHLKGNIPSVAASTTKSSGEKIIPRRHETSTSDKRIDSCQRLPLLQRLSYSVAKNIHEPISPLPFKSYPRNFTNYCHNVGNRNNFSAYDIVSDVPSQGQPNMSIPEENHEIMNNGSDSAARRIPSRSEERLSSSHYDSHQDMKSSPVTERCPFTTRNQVIVHNDVLDSLRKEGRNITATNAAMSDKGLDVPHAGLTPHPVTVMESSFDEQGSHDPASTITRHVRDQSCRKSVASNLRTNLLLRLEDEERHIHKALDSKKNSQGLHAHTSQGQGTSDIPQSPSSKLNGDLLEDDESDDNNQGRSMQDCHDPHDEGSSMIEDNAALETRLRSRARLRLKLAAEKRRAGS